MKRQTLSQENNMTLLQGLQVLEFFTVCYKLGGINYQDCMGG